MKRVYQKGYAKDGRSFLLAVQKDRSLQLFLLWSVVSSMLLCLKLYQVWIETKSPFKMLGLDVSSTYKEIKQAYRDLSFCYEMNYGC